MGYFPLMNLLLRWDQIIFDSINSGFPLKNLDVYANFLSASTTWWGAALIGGVACLIFKKIAWVKALLIGAIALGVSDMTCTYLLKPWQQRMRPCHQKQVQLRAGSCGGDYGMPSNHASNGAAFLVASAFLLPLKASLLIGISVFLVGWSRIYLGVHFPLDIIVGYFVGGTLGWGVGLTLTKTMTYLAQKTRRNAAR